MNFTDALTEHPWAAADGLRIPLIEAMNPRYSYEVALVVPHEHSPALWPCEEEARVIGSFIDYRREHYDVWYQEKMKREQLDVDPTTNTVVLRLIEGGWQYRLGTWDHGPIFAPIEGTSPGVAGLIAVLDRYRTIDGEIVKRWADWKVSHPEIFL